jgi:ribosomal protein L21E
MHTTPRLLDVVALLTDVPDHGLVRGQVGTVVEELDGAFEVEFSDDEGRTYAEIALSPEHLLVLHHRPQQAA